MSAKYWLLKAEPDSRIVKGKDVKFSVDDFERVKTSPWEGVRNYEARNLMKEMKIGEKAVFYHSNCKNPGIAAFAEIDKEAYPDYTAWDESHPYYDVKSEKNNPKWYMVDLRLTARAKHFIPLALLRYVADSTTEEPPEEVKYIGEAGVNAIKAMHLVSRGRLSVQRVDAKAWETIHLLADNGGWEEIDFKSRKVKPTTNAKAKAGSSKAATKVVRRGRKTKVVDGDQGEETSPTSPSGEGTEDGEGPKDTKHTRSGETHTRKRKIVESNDANPAAPRRSNRRKVAN